MGYFKDEELYYSYTAESNNKDNKPSEKQLEHMKFIRDKYLNPIRKKFGSAIKISSGYRGEWLNKKVGGVSNSNHLFGFAFDLLPVNNKAKELFKCIKDFLLESSLPYDELIYEYSGNTIWVHFAVRDTNNRSKVIDNYKKV